MIEQDLNPNISAHPTEDVSKELTVHYDQPWLTSISRPLLIAILTSCLSIGFLSFLRFAIPGMPNLYAGTIVVITVIATIMGCVSTTWLNQPAQRMKRNAGIRLAELGLILGIVRLLSWMTVGNWPTLMQFFTRPLDAMMDGAFILSVIVVGLAWSLATAITSDFIKMSLQPDELYAAEQRTGRSTDDPTPPNYTDRRSVLGGFVSKWIGGGVLLVLLSAGTQLKPSENGFFALGRQNIDPVVITATVLYFLVGLILISQGQFAVLRARWTLEKVPSTESVVRNWPIYATIMIGGIGLLATMLPFGGTFYFAQIVSTILRTTYMIVGAVIQLFLGLFAMFLSLFMGESVEEEVAPPPIDFAPFQMPEAPPEAAGGPPWLGGAIFWILISLLLGYAAYVYLSGRGLNVAWLRRFWHLLTMRLRELFGAYEEWRITRTLRRNGLKDNSRSSGTPDDWFNRLRLSDLNPDQKIRYFYMYILYQADKVGLGRRKAETPLQYGPRLAESMHPAIDTEDVDANDPVEDGFDLAEAEKKRETALAETKQQLRSLTDAFLRVRYAGTSSSETSVSPLKDVWESLKTRLGR